MRDQLAAVLGELRRMEAGGGVDDELLATIRLITVTLGGIDVYKRQEQSSIFRIYERKQTVLLLLRSWSISAI